MKILKISLFCLIGLISAKQDHNIHKVLISNEKNIVSSKNATLEDCISFVIYTTEDPIILTKKDFQRDSINGGKPLKEDLILQHIMAYHARTMYKMEASDEMMEKYLQSIMDQHGLTRDQIKLMFSQAGYTFEEGVDQLRMMYLIDSLLNYKIKSRLVVSEEAIENYYNEHPEYITGFYRLESGYIASTDITEDQIKHWDMVQKTFAPIEWSDSYQLEENEISQERSFIKDLKPGQISALEEVPSGFEFVRLVEKQEPKLKSLEECHRSITDTLRAPLFDALFKEYKSELLKEYEIVYVT